MVATVNPQNPFAVHEACQRGLDEDFEISRKLKMCRSSTSAFGMQDVCILIAWIDWESDIFYLIWHNLIARVALQKYGGKMLFSSTRIQASEWVFQVGHGNLSCLRLEDELWQRGRIYRVVLTGGPCGGKSSLVAIPSYCECQSVIAGNFGLNRKSFARGSDKTPELS